MLEKKIELLGEYFDGMFRLPKEQNGVRVIIPSNWKTYSKETEEYTIEPNVSEVINNDYVKIIFVGTPKAKINDIMDFIHKVIMDNVENEKKTELFQIKIKELASVFDSNQLSKLELLVFKFEKQKKSKKFENDTNEKIEVETKPISDEEVKKLDEIRKLSQEKD